MSCTFLSFIHPSVIASLLGTNVFFSTLHSYILAILHKLSPYWFSLIFQMTFYSETEEQ